VRLLNLRLQIRVIDERGMVVRDVVDERMRGATTRVVGKSVLVEDPSGAFEASASKVQVARGRAERRQVTESMPARLPVNSA
jgi:hypothetical protein